MSEPAVAGAILRCSCGAIPTALIVLPANRVFICGRPAATTLDFKPVVNIPTFGMCRSPTNPEVAAATAAAAGVLTPMPCVPATIEPWTGCGGPVRLGGAPLLQKGGKLVCAFGGTIEIVSPGQIQVKEK